MRSEEVQKAFVKAALNAYRISNFSSSIRRLARTGWLKLAIVSILPPSPNPFSLVVLIRLFFCKVRVFSISARCAGKPRNGRVHNHCSICTIDAPLGKAVIGTPQDFSKLLAAELWAKETKSVLILAP